MNIARKMYELLVCFHKNCLKWTLVERAYPMALRIEIFGIPIGNVGKKVMDTLLDVLPNNEVKMVWHETVGKNINGEGLLIKCLAEYCSFRM